MTATLRSFYAECEGYEFAWNNAQLHRTFLLIPLVKYELAEVSFAVLIVFTSATVVDHISFLLQLHR